MSDEPHNVTGTNESVEFWHCKNCNHQNKGSDLHCEGCGYKQGFDPEAKVEIDFKQVQETIQLQDEQRSRRLGYIIEFTKLGLLLIIAITFLLLFSRLTTDWPFMGAYERDADQLAGAVLAIESRLQHYIEKGDYDLLVATALVEKNQFKIKYSESKWRHSNSYTKLIQAAEYYQIAGESWERHLLENSLSNKVDERARSDEADESILSLWKTASSNLMAALEDLR